MFAKYIKCAHEISVHNGSDAFLNELMRFRFEATPIWENIQKHCTNAVTDFLNRKQLNMVLLENGPPKYYGPSKYEEPSRPGPGPLAPQAKPVRPRTLGPP